MSDRIVALRFISALVELLRPLLHPHLDEEEQRAVAGAALAAYTGLITQGMADPDMDARTALQRFMHSLQLWDQATRLRARTGDPDARPSDDQRTH